MQKYKKPVIIPEDLGYNPFLHQLQIPVNRLKQDHQFEYDAVNEINIPATHLVEDRSYTRLYKQADNRLQTNNLSDRALRLFIWILYSVDTSADYIWINHIRYQEENNIKAYNTYKDARNELIRYGYLAPTVKTGIYWINPAIFFSGNPVRRFRQQVVIRSDQSK